MNGILQRVLKKTEDDLIALLSEVEEFLEQHGVPGNAILRVRLILEEMILNVIKHARGSANQEIDVRLEVTGDGIIVQIEDDGTPFDPRLAPAFDKTKPLEDRETGGMGIQIVRTLVSELHYERRAGRNCVRLVVAIQHTHQQ